MYQFRTFRNSDPPNLVEIWRSQPPQRGVMQPITSLLLEQFVFAKPYFDPAGLIVATKGDVPVGFVHAGFGANEQESALDYDFGTTYQLMLHGNHRDSALADELLSRSETYLRSRGAKVIYVGGVRPLNGFYLGLYGGSELPGVLSTDPVLVEAALRNGYREIDRVVVFLRDLAGFRPPDYREHRLLRREVTCREIDSPPSTTWWEANTTGAFERIYFSLEKTRSGQRLGGVWFWEIEPLSSGWGVPTAGMYDLQTESDQRRRGLATYLLTEIFTRLKNRGFLAFEAQTMASNAPAISLYGKLGFERLADGIVFRKDQ